MSENAANKQMTARPHSDMALTTGGAMLPRSLEQAIEVAKMIASSGMVPKHYAGNVGAVLIAFQMGAEVGLPPMAAIQNIAVINGRPSLWGDAMLGVCMAHASFVDVVEDDLDTIRKNSKATCIATRKGLEPRTGTFTVDMAKEAGLWNKAGPWQQYPARMLQMRARGFALRDTWPDVLRGLYMAEEARDIPKPVEGNIIATTQLTEGTHDLRRKAEPDRPPDNDGNAGSDATREAAAEWHQEKTGQSPPPEPEPEPEPMTAKAKMAAIRDATSFEDLAKIIEGEERASVLKVADTRKRQLDKVATEEPPGSSDKRPAPPTQEERDAEAKPALGYCVCGPDVVRLENAKVCHSCGQPYEIGPDVPSPPTDPETMPMWGMGADESEG